MAASHGLQVVVSHGSLEPGRECGFLLLFVSIGGIVTVLSCTLLQPYNLWVSPNVPTVNRVSICLVLGICCFLFFPFPSSVLIGNFVDS